MKWSQSNFYYACIGNNRKIDYLRNLKNQIKK